MNRINRNTKLLYTRDTATLHLLAGGILHGCSNIRKEIRSKYFVGTVTPKDSIYPSIFYSTLGILASSLLRCPMTETDGKPGERTYFAQTMDFKKNQTKSLRDLGEYLNPYNYNPREIKNIIDWRRALYKLEVRFPSNIIGFSLGAYGPLPGKPKGIWFKCFDAGNTFTSEYKTGLSGTNDILQMASFQFNLIKEPDFKIDFIPREVNFDDIDNYQ